MFLSDLTQRSGLMHGENVSFVPIRYPRRVIAPEVDLSITIRIMPLESAACHLWLYRVYNDRM